MSKGWLSVVVAAGLLAAQLSSCTAGNGDGFEAIHCEVTDDTSATRGVAVGTLVASDSFEGCLLGELIVCPDNAGSEYDDIRCGEIQTGSVRRSSP